MSLFVIKGPIITRPYEPTAEIQTLILSPKKIELQAKIKALVDRKDEFSTEQDAAVYERAVERALADVDEVANNLHALEQLPYEMISVNERRSLKKKKQTLNARALTTNELAELQAKQALKEASQMARNTQILAEREQQFQQLETQAEIVCAPKLVRKTPSPPPATAPIRKPTPPLEASPSPPPSTAIPTLTGERTKRPRAQIGFYTALGAGNSHEARQKRARK